TVSPTPDDAAAVVPAAPVDGQPGTEIERDKRAEDVRRGQDTMRFLRRVPFALGHFLLKLVPVAVCVGIGNLGVALLPQTDEAEVVGLTTVNAYVIARCLYLVVETIFAPSSPGLRLWMVSTAIARRIVRWWAVLVAAPAIIVWLTTVGSTFDMAPRGVQALIRAIVLIEHLLLAMFIWRLRGPVADGLQPSAARQKQPFWAFMAHLARIWWLPAIFLDIAFWGVWATQRHDGYRWIWQATGLTVAVLALGRLLGIALFSLQDRLFRLGGRGVETTESTPLQRRLDRYYPLARRTTNAMVVVLTAVALLQVWGVPSVAFFTGNPVGVRLLSAVVTILVAITIGIVVWEISNTMLDRRVELYSSGDAVSRAVRLRTVLPIIRTVLAVFIIIIVTVTTLSQIGINVAPLLTGAGILGAAIAFGSQSLVKDFITGFFMLVENAIQVGDVVTAAGVTGTVEHLSIRTLRLRTSAGDINIIPFSSVTSVSNQSRDYNYVTVTLTLDLGEDPDRVAALIDQVVGEMRDEPAFATRVQSGFNNLGVNSADAGGAVLIGRVRVEAGARATIERELYRRLRGLFVANAVHFPGWAPPIMRLVTEAPIDVAFTGEAPSAPPPPLPPSPTAAPSGAAPAEVPTDDAPRPAAS
ncbi:mechanosensitive ion channel family protein, partial [Ameyamaea chiangmaiensis]